MDSETRWSLVRKLRQRPTPEPVVEIIRQATATDLPAIRDIYNYFIRNTAITFDDKPLDLNHWRELYELISKLELPFLVLDRGGELIGFAYLQPWRQRAGYQKVVETSIYLSAPATGKGFGTKLMSELVDRAKGIGVREIIAVIADRGADASIAIHKKFGFSEQGHLANVANRFGRPIGSYLFSLQLPKG